MSTALNKNIELLAATQEEVFDIMRKISRIMNKQPFPEELKLEFDSLASTLAKQAELTGDVIAGITPSQNKKTP